MAKRAPSQARHRLRELVERIWRTNPTGRGYRRDEEQGRYAEKAKLQSLLIEEYPEEVKVSAQADMPGIVSLRVPRLAASAAHAALSALSAPARCWIEEQLQAQQERAQDAGAAAPAGVTRQHAAASFGLAQAERLLAEFDFEGAEALLAQLLDNEQAAPAERRGALLLLLELYADHLAQDEKAVALVPHVDALAAWSPRVHELIGVAAHRLGDLAGALHQLRHGRSERVATLLGDIACAAAEARQWALALEAWACLREMAEQQAIPGWSLLAMPVQETAHRLKERALAASDEALAADGSLVDFVQSLAPQHPWLRDHRQRVLQLRARAAVQSLLTRAAALAERGELEELDRTLSALARYTDDLEAAEAARLRTLASLVEHHRATLQVARVLALAEAAEFEASCRLFLTLPQPSRSEVVAAYAGPLFADLLALLAALPEKSSARAAIGAASAWSQARDIANEAARWRRLSPHAALLAAVPAIAKDLQRLRELAAQEASPPPAARPQPVGHTLQLGDLLLTEGSQDPWEAGERLDIASEILRLGSTGYVAVLERFPGAEHFGVALLPVHAGVAPRRLRFTAPSDFQPRAVLASEQSLFIVAGHALLRIELSPALAATRVALQLPEESLVWQEAVLLEKRTLAVCSRLPAQDAEQWALLDVQTGALLRSVSPQKSYRAAGAQGTSIYLREGTGFVKLQAADRGHQRFALPARLADRCPLLAVLEWPFTKSPLLLTASPAGAEALLWWQPQECLLRAFSLCELAEHGALLGCASLPARGLLIVTRRADGAAVAHEVPSSRSTLFASGKSTVLEDYLTLVVDPIGRRSFAACRRGGAGVQLVPLCL